MKYFLTLIVAGFFAGHCFAETPGHTVSTNTVAVAKAPPKIWSGTGTFGLTATSGNVNSVLVNGKINAERKTKIDDLTLESDGAYGEISSVKNAESLHGCAQENHTFVDDTWYGYGRGDGLHDAIADVEYRFTTSAGAGYYFIKNKMTTLSTEAGPAFETEHLDDEYHDYPTARIAQNFVQQIDDHAKLWENVEFIPPLTFPDAFLVNAQVGVDTPLTKKLSLETYVQDNFANVPAPGFKDNDVKVVSGIVFKF